MNNPKPHTPLDREHPDIIRARQWERIKDLLSYVYKHSPFYRERMDSLQCLPETIDDWEDFRQIPCTTKEDLQQHNWAFLCVPRQEIAEYTTTSGTLGQPVTIALTASDLDRLAYNEYCSLQLMELSAADSLQLMLTLDKQFMAGMAYYNGARKLGAALIRTGPGLPQMQLDTIQRLHPSVLVAVPSFLLKLKALAATGIVQMDSLSPKKVLAIGEAIRLADGSPNSLARNINHNWSVELFGTYAATEMQTAFTECRAHQGGHLQPELLHVELLDDEGQAVAPGTMGEVTITTLGVQGMPLLRYRTGDLCIADYSPCSCGRNSLRLGPVLGRKKQMIKYKGTSLYPPMLAEVLHKIDLIREYVIELDRDELEQDVLKLYLHTDRPEAIDHHLIRQTLQSALRVLPQIEWCSIEQIMQLQFPNGNRKPVRFWDKRTPA